jgi:hypothetical protein
MSTLTAKDLLAQADRLMRQRLPEELPVLTDLVIEEIELTSLSDRMDDVIPTHSTSQRMPAHPLAEHGARVPVPEVAAPALPPAVSVAAGPSTNTAAANVRDQFNAQLLSKLEEMRHGVYSQVMQQLEIHASGSLQNHLRDTVLHTLNDVLRDLAQQIAEDTSHQVREVVSRAVDSEIARLREQLSKQRSHGSY